jgi:peptidoglycan/xylan/chitin deacetylase (PgdA/CDA1 family)
MFATLRSRIKQAVRASVAPCRLAAPGGVLLTFDDGPHPDVTPAVLDRLKQYGTRGLFFVVGRRIARAPHLLARIEREGHLLGNHSFLHVPASRLGLWGYAHDLECCQTAVAARIGTRPTLFRPPFGELSSTTLLAARYCGLHPVYWTLDAQDWRCRTPDDAIGVAERIVATVKAREIVLLHDDHPDVLTILDRLLPVLQQRDLLRAAQPMHWGVRKIG